MDMLKGLEKDFKCAGYCDLGDYYLSVDLKEGPPEIECVEGFLQGI
jgi:hypothetical protein